MSAAITGKQVRDGRKLLGWDGVSLAMRAKVNPTLLIKFETGGPLPAEAVTAVRRALEVAGIEFLPEGKAWLRDAVEEAMP